MDLLADNVWGVAAVDLHFTRRVGVLLAKLEGDSDLSSGTARFPAVVSPVAVISPVTAAIISTVAVVSPVSAVVLPGPSAVTLERIDCFLDIPGVTIVEVSLQIAVLD